MLSLTTIREDLKDIRYYYMRKKMFEQAFESTGVNDIVMKVEKYNGVIRSATPKIYDLYVSLYINNHTQESLSNAMGFTQEYIQQLNKKLLKFLQSKLQDEKEEIRNV